MRLSPFFLTALLALALGHPAGADDLLPAGKSIPEVIDHYIDAQHAEQAIKSAPLADDATVLRRLTLDLVGRIPTAAEVKAYTSSADPDKKTRLVDRLMASPAFNRHLVTELDAMLAPSSSERRGGNLRDYLSRAVKENRRWDDIFRDLILADEKQPISKGASAFLKSRVRDLDQLTTDVSVLFFGVNISCAQCHDHPLVLDWKQDHYYGLKSFFASTFEAGQFLGEREPAVVQFKTTKNEARTARLMFLTGQAAEVAVEKAPAPPKRPPNRGGKGGTPPPAPKVSARAALADLALRPTQRDFFARSIVNRTWHRLFGLGLVTPVDQMHSANPASHPELLAWLARDTAENGYDLKRLTRGLVLSKAYARSSAYEGERQPPARSFAVARLRALTPMQLALSLRVAVASPDQFPADLKADELDRKMQQLEGAARGLAGHFEHPRDDFQISVSEALLFSNSDQVQRELLADGGDRLLGRLKAVKSIDEGVDLAVRNVLSRPPTALEKKALAAYLSRREGRLAEAYKQVLWALVSGAEVRFNY